MAIGRPQWLRSGPWKGVFSTTDPFDDDESLLQDALNGYLPDARNGSGWFQRPAFIRPTGPLSLGSQRAAAGWQHTMNDGTQYNFLAINGKLYRVSGDLQTQTDVTPVGVTIDNGLTTRVYFQSFNNYLIVSDGVNRPWYGTNLGSTPITGTYIDYNGAGTAWTAFGQPTLFSGDLVFIVNSPPAGAAAIARLGIAWSEPGDPTIGYEQSGYTNFANIIQNSSRRLFAICGTNVGLYYWRDTGIGLASGIVDGSFQTTATHDLISSEIGCIAPATVQLYGTDIFFCDQFGRPQHIPVGSGLTEPQIWLQMRQYVESQTQAAGYATAIQNVAVAAVEPNLNLYLAAPWSSGSLGVNNNPATTLYAFDAKTRRYAGRWEVSNGCYVTGLPIFRDTNGAQQLVAIGSTAAAQSDNVLWGLKRLSDAQWSDSTNAQTVSITTGRLGYATDVVWDVGETGSLVTMASNAVAVSVKTPYTASTAEGTPTPATSQDGTYRCVVGMDVHAARGIQVTASPTLGASQWGAQQWEMLAVPSKAGPEEA